MELYIIHPDSDGPVIKTTLLEFFKANSHLLMTECDVIRRRIINDQPYRSGGGAMPSFILLRRS